MRRLVAGSGLGRSSRSRLAFVMAGLIVIFTLAAPARVALAGGSCTNAHLGIVCDTVYTNGYDAFYRNQSGQCFWADFNLITLGSPGAPGGTYGDDGPFWTCPGQDNSYFFAVGFQGCSQVVVYDRSNGQPPQNSNGNDWTLACSP